MSYPGNLRFIDLVERLSTNFDQQKADKAHTDLVNRWSEPHRKYHTLRHLYDVLRILDEFKGTVFSTAGTTDEAEFALWFHDAIYEIGVPGNESRSAELAIWTGTHLGIPLERVQRIAYAIQSTAYPCGFSDFPADSHEVCKVVRGCDLAPLGAHYSAFCQDTENVWDEYKVDRTSKTAFAKAQVSRAIILDLILATRPFADYFLRYDFPARENVKTTMIQALHAAKEVL